MLIINVERDDLETIFVLYDRAIEFQKTVFDKHWLGFETDLVNKEIDERRLWKIVEDGHIACIYTINYSDPMLWGEKDLEPAMYIHRIVTNPEYRGRGYARKITEWARGHAAESQLRYIRMDTWADNKKLLDYYQDCGFKFVGLIKPQVTDDMPKHYVGLELCLLEIDLGHVIPS